MKNQLSHAVASCLFIFLSIAPLKAQDLSTQQAQAPHFDPNQLSQAFVLEAKQILIPQHPHAFNGSIIRYHDRLLMSFRELDTSYPIEEENSSGHSNIGLVWLDDNFEVVSTPQLIRLGVRIEDPRLIQVDDQLFLVFADTDSEQDRERLYRRMYKAPLTLEGDLFTIGHARLLANFEGELDTRHEKNWVPFDFCDQLLFSYSLNPHRVLYPSEDGSCCDVGTTHCNYTWPWGELRGGTPALALDDDYYLGFFHSSTTLASSESAGQAIPHYFMGAYLFHQRAPFAITHISTEPIVHPSFYAQPHHEPYWGDVRVVFPCGFLFDETYIWLTFGRQDHELWVAKLDKQALLDSLKPVTGSRFDRPLTLLPIQDLPRTAWPFEFQLASDEAFSLQQAIETLRTVQLEQRATLQTYELQLNEIGDNLESQRNTGWGGLAYSLEHGNFIQQFFGRCFSFFFSSYRQAVEEQRALELSITQKMSEIAQQLQACLSTEEALNHQSAWHEKLVEHANQLSALINAQAEND